MKEHATIRGGFEYGCIQQPGPYKYRMYIVDIKLDSVVICVMTRLYNWTTYGYLSRWKAAGKEHILCWGLNEIGIKAQTIFWGVGKVGCNKITSADWTYSQSSVPSMATYMIAEIISDLFPVMEKI